MIIGLDLDGVVADSLSIVVEKLDAHYGGTFRKGDHFDLSKYFQLPREEIAGFLTDKAEEIFGRAPLVKGAAEGIAALCRDGHEIIYITARQRGREEEITRAWLDKQGLGGSKAFCVSGGTKTEIILEQGVEVFVDDFLKNARQISAIGIPVLLFDAYYNQEEELENVIRCYSWDDILMNIALLTERKETR